MSLNKVTLRGVVWQQLCYKLRAYHQVFTSLVVLQLIALLISFTSVSSHGGGGFGVDAMLNIYSSEVILIFTFVWAVINAYVITTEDYREDDFLFVTNHTSQHLANSLFLVTASIIGGVTTTLADYLLRILLFSIKDQEMFVGTMDDVSPVLDPLIGTVAATFYILMFCALGYVFGSVVQKHRIFVYVIPALAIGVLFLSWTVTGTSVFALIIQFYVGETNFLLFTLKTLSTAIVLFAGSYVLMGHKEVRA